MRRLARQQGALEEREAQQPELLRLSRELSARDTQLAEMHSQLRQVHQELAATTADLQQAASTHSAEADSATGKLIEARQWLDQQAAAQQQLAQTVSELAEQNARLVAAVELLRLRTRVLIVAVVVLAVGVGVLLAR